MGVNNFEYWKTSLEEIFMEFDVFVTDNTVKQIMDISNLEHEYCESESIKPSKLEKRDFEIESLENDKVLLIEKIKELTNVDYVTIENGTVSLTNKLP